MKEYCVYLLHCADDSYYTGITNNIDLRFEQHQAGVDPNCYTYKRRPLTLVHVESFRDVNDAIGREKQIKRWSRRKKAALIAQDDELLFKLAECKNISHCNNRL